MNIFSFLLDTAADGTGTGSDIYTWVIIGVFALLGVWMFIGFKRNKKEEQEYVNMRDSLMVGDEVTTIGGIIGKIVSIKDETFVLETTKDRTKIRFLKGAIKRVDVKISDIAAENGDKITVKADEKPDAAPVLQAEDAAVAEAKAVKAKAKAEKKAEKKAAKAKEADTVNDAADDASDK